MTPSATFLFAAVVSLGLPRLQGKLLSECVRSPCGYCRDVLQVSNGEIWSGCLSQPPLMTGNENRCVSTESEDLNMRPLLVNDTANLFEAYCGKNPSKKRTDCPKEFKCNENLADVYAVCCRKQDPKVPSKKCPPSSLIGDPNCVKPTNECSFDDKASCGTGKICCPDGCGRSCTEPKSTT